MFDEFRAICRDIQSMGRDASFHETSSQLSTSVAALVQGLILGMRCYSVFETEFGIGIGAAAVGSAFRRLPSGRPMSYIAGSEDRERAKFYFTGLKRKYVHWTPYVQIRFGTHNEVANSVAAETVDLAIVHGSLEGEQTLAAAKAVVHTLKTHGFILVAWRDTPPSLNGGLREWLRSQRVIDWTDQGGIALIQASPTN